MWRLRKWFWNLLATKKFAGNKLAVIPIPKEGPKKIAVVAFSSQFPGIPIPNIRVADHVPADEAKPLTVLFYRFQVAMYCVLSAMQKGLPSIDADPQKAFDEAYTEKHRKLFPPPVLPDEYRGAVDLGRLAVASPYACYVERAPEGGFHWDFRTLARYEHHEGLVTLGARVLFRVNERERRLEAVQIDCELGSVKAGEPAWESAQKVALCALTTHCSLVRHFLGVHLAAGTPFAIATRNSLPADHPLRRLLWPHMFGTQYSNQIVTRGQMSKGGDFDTTFSFTHAGMCKLYEEHYEKYDVSVLDPALDAEQRGIRGAGFDTPALENREAIFDVMRAHTGRYLHVYYDSDERLRADKSVENFVRELEALIPGGVRKLVGAELSIAGVARLAAALIYLASVEHEILGTGLWNYQLWTHVQPIRVYRDGRREPLDVYQRLVNANFNLNVTRAPLLGDFTQLALDPKGAEAFRLFQSDLRQLQEKMDREPAACWNLSPRILETTMNA